MKNFASLVACESPSKKANGTLALSLLAAKKRSIIVSRLGRRACFLTTSHTARATPPTHITFVVC